MPNLRDASVRLVTELALANKGYVTMPPGGNDGNALIKSGNSLAWGAVGGTAVNKINGRNGNITLDKADVGLGNVDNTSDTDKPISDATASALAEKVDLPSFGFDGQVLAKSGDTSAWASPATSSAPATSTSTGTPGTIAYDSSYIYVCTASNTWQRAALGSW